jgi:predicted ATPase
MPGSVFSNLFLSNFRAFSDDIEIPLGKITLLYGQNSAGKSSIIKSLLLLQQTFRDSQQSRRGKFIFSGDSVDLGSFSTTVNNHDVSKKISVGVSYAGRDRKSQLSQQNFELIWTVDSHQDLSKLSMKINEYEFIFHCFKNDRTQRTDFILDPLCVEAWCVFVTQNQNLFSVNDPVIEDLRLGVGFVPTFSGGLIPRDFRGCTQVNPAELPTQIRPTSTKTYTSQLREDSDDTSPGVRQLISSDVKSAEFWFDVVRPLAQQLSSSLRSTSYLGPLRREPQRLERYVPTSERDVGSDGEDMLSLLFEQPGLVQQVNNYLGLMDLPYRIKVDTLGQQSTVGSVIYLTLQNSNGLEVSPTDVGVGYSQVLPLLTQSVLSRNSLICVEQPELHLHPAMQARLGDMFIEQTLSGHNVQFLIETHSESLMLRFLRRVREGKISPQEIQVLYVDQDRTGRSLIYNLPILPNGEFGAAWPHGFFDERLEEFGF